VGYEELTSADTSFTAWMLECGRWWLSRNEEDAYEWPAYPWREWYDEGLSVAQAIEQANIRLFGRPRGS
jgi:hypothetical protein